MLQLEFRADGVAELTDPDDIDQDGNIALIWSSDSDEDFHDHITTEFLTEDDADAIIDYLVDSGVIDEDEAADVEVYVDESGGPGDDEDDEDDDEDYDVIAGDTIDGEAQHLS